MTLTLTRETEAQLVAVAALRGKPPEDALAELVSEAQAEHEETVIALRQSMAEIAAGRWVSLEQFEQNFAAQVQRRRADERE